ncbi:MAG: LysR family transcriptional regulator [Eubacteriales bacterium]|nr:LysR family transcriptional regulator [Eubacteriales bacterium]
MNLNQLEYFISAANNLNFTKAAQECFISQTAMTQQIQALEKNLGVKLFIRDKHHTELTPAGKVYYKEAREIIKKSNEAVKRARIASTGLVGELTLGYSSGFGQTDCAEILKGFHQAFPNIKVKLKRNTLSILMEGIQKGEIDMAFAVSPHQNNYEHINRVYLKSYPLYVVMSSDNPLADREAIEYKDLKDENFILMQPVERSRDETDEVLWLYNKGGFLPNVVALDKEPENIMLMCSLGDGVCLLPEYIVRPYMKNDSIAFVPVINSDRTAENMNFEIVWAEDNVNPTVENMIEWCRSH